MSDSLDFDVTSTEEAETSLSGGGAGRTSKYEPIAQKYSEIDQESEAIKLSGLQSNEVQNIRNLLYRRFGKENVIVRSSKVSDDPEKYDAVVRQREGGEYLRNGENETDSDGEMSDDIADEADTPSEEDVEPTEAPSDDDEDLEGVFE